MDDLQRTLEEWQRQALAAQRMNRWYRIELEELKQHRKHRADHYDSKSGECRAKQPLCAVMFEVIAKIAREDTEQIERLQTEAMDFALKVDDTAHLNVTSSGDFAKEAKIA